MRVNETCKSLTLDLGIDMLLKFSSTYARVLPLDRVSRPSITPQATLYFDPEGPTAQSSSLIKYLDYHAGYRPEFSYIIRYRPSPGQSRRPKSKMAGYGVELALKRTDYLVVDDRNSGSVGPESQDQSANASLSSGSFEEILGSDPWADLAVPLTKSEVMGRSTCGSKR
jgi:hypothetical protein